MDVTWPALVLDAPLSLWGGFDPVSGRITDTRHPNCGVHLADQVLVLETTKGSAGGASILGESIWRGTGPAGIILHRSRLDVAIGTLTPEVLYGIKTPFTVVEGDAFYEIRTGDRIRVTSEGQLERLVDVQSGPRDEEKLGT